MTASIEISGAQLAGGALFLDRIDGPTGTPRLGQVWGLTQIPNLPCFVQFCPPATLGFDEPFLELNLDNPLPSFTLKPEHLGMLVRVAMFGLDGNGDWDGSVSYSNTIGPVLHASDPLGTWVFSDADLIAAMGRNDPLITLAPGTTWDASVFLNRTLTGSTITTPQHDPARIVDSYSRPGRWLDVVLEGLLFRYSANWCRSNRGNVFETGATTDGVTFRGCKAIADDVPPSIYTAVPPTLLQSPYRKPGIVPTNPALPYTQNGTDGMDFVFQGFNLLRSRNIRLEGVFIRNVLRAFTLPGSTTIRHLRIDGWYSDGYVRGDQVVSAGSTYQLIVDASTGNDPPDAARWILVAAAGSGDPGAAGADGYSVIVTNESHTVPTDADGAGGDYSTAGGVMQILRGNTPQSPTFSIAARTPNTAWISIDSAGVYTITDPGVDLATATLRANVAGINFDRTYTLAKTKQGVNGAGVQLTADRQGFVFTDNVADPSGQSISLTATIAGIAGSPVFTTSPSVPLSGTGNTRTLSIADFGGNRQVTVTVTVGSLSDRITLVRIDRSTAEAGATQGAPGGTSVAGMPVEQLRQGSDTDLYDSFSAYASQTEFERAWSFDSPFGPTAPAPVAFISSASSPGGRYLSLGDNSGSDFVVLAGKRTIPYDAEDLYCIEWDVEFPEAGSGLLYLGVRAIDSGGNNVAGNGVYHYVGAAALDHATVGAVRHTFRGYFRGYGTTGVSNDAANPTPITAGVVRIAPLALLRYDAGIGRSFIHSVRLFKAADFAPIFSPYSAIRVYRQNEGVTFDGRSFVSRRDSNLGNTPPTSNTSDANWLLTSARGAPGDAGAPGSNTATVALYRRTTTASAPAGPSGDFTYQFASGAVIENVAGAFNGWSPSIPSAGGPYRWQIQAYVSGTAATAPIGTGAWSVARLIAEDGLDGRDAIPFYQEGTPISPIIGDTWLQPSTRIWRRWDGSAWVNVLGAFAAANIIGAANVAAFFETGVFGDAYIANLNAAKINVGLLSALRINLDGLTLSNGGGVLQIAGAGVNTQQIAPQAVSRASAVQRAPTMLLDSTWQTVETVSLTTAGGTLVRLDVSALGIIPVNNVGAGGGVQYRWVRNGTVVVASGVFFAATAFQETAVDVGGVLTNITINGFNTGRHAAISLDSGASAGANSWQLQVQTGVAGATVADVTLIATELRR